MWTTDFLNCRIFPPSSAALDKRLPTMSLTSPHPSIAAQTIVLIDWRVDIVVGTGHSVARVGVPTIVLGLTLSSGIILTYRLTQEELHQWRFSLAKAVRDLAYLDKKRPPPNMFAPGKKVSAVRVV